MKIERKKLPKLAYGFVYETEQISAGFSPENDADWTEEDEEEIKEK